MMDTDLSCFKDQVLRKAIEKGVYSRIASTNARMLVNGVLPALANDIVTKYANDDTWGDKASRLEAFCSFRFAMDFAVRAHVNLNGLVDEEKRRGKLLDCAFHYMLKTALKSAQSALGPCKSTAASSQLRAMEAHAEEDKQDTAVDEENKVDDEDIFRVGLATRDMSKTSNALRYLACNGKTAPLYRADGTSFENVIAVHLHRYSESLGTSTDFAELRYAWPPAAEKNTRLDDEREVNKRVAEMLKNGAADVKTIVDFFVEAINDADGRSVALVLRQGVPNAQGADVMKFEVKNFGEKKVLEVLRIKQRIGKP
jgi:hypothetical protein